MKKLLLAAFVLTILGASQSFAQKRVGAGLAWGSEAEAVGLNINAEFFLNNKLSITPGFTLFFTDDPVSWWTINGDVHYFFQEGPDGFYGLAGLNISHISIDLSAFGFGDVDDTAAGLNVGAGYSLNAGALSPFGEIKYVISDHDQLVLSAGVRFTF